MNFANFYEKLKESALGFFIDKVLSIGAGIATLILGSIFLPGSQLVFKQYYPFNAFLEKYIVYCLVIMIFSFVMWWLIRGFQQIRVLLPLVIAGTIILISELMRNSVYLPTDVGIQFILYFSGILILCEALIFHVCRVVLELVIQAKKA